MEGCEGGLMCGVVYLLVEGGERRLGWVGGGWGKESWTGGVGWEVWTSGVRQDSKNTGGAELETAE